MAQIKISELETLTEVIDDDYTVIVDSDVVETKKVHYDTLKNYFNADQDERLDDLELNVSSNESSIRRLENNIFESGEAEGETITLNDSVLSELKDLEIKAVNRQVTTQGNQLVDFSKLISMTGITTSFENDKLIVTSDGSGKYHSTSLNITNVVKNNPGKKLYFDYENLTSAEIPNGTIVQLTVYYNDNTSDQYKALVNKSFVKSSWSIPEDTSVISGVTFGIYPSNASTTLANTITIVKPMLQFGTDKLEYEPFTNLLPSPSPDYPQSVPVMESGEVLKTKSIGKSLVDFSKKIKGSAETTYTDDILTIVGNGVKYSGAYYDVLDILKNHQGEKISLYFKSESTTNLDIQSLVQIEIYYNDDTPTAYLLLHNFTKDTKYTRQIPTNMKNATHALLYFVTTTTDANNTIKIEKPMFYIGTINDDVDFEPYQESKIEATIPEGEFFGAVSDTIADKLRVAYNEEDGENHIYLDKVVGRKILDGTESWSKRGTNASNITTYSTETIKDYAYKDTNQLGISTHYNRIIKVSGATEINTKEVGLYYYYAPNQTSRVMYINSIIADLEEFKQWLSSNNVTILYQLEEPYTIDLGATNQLKTYNNITNIFNNSSLNPSMLVHYYRNFVATIRNLQINNGALQTELANLESRLASLESSVSSIQTSQVESEVAQDVIQEG